MNKCSKKNVGQVKVDKKEKYAMVSKVKTLQK